MEKKTLIISISAAAQKGVDGGSQSSHLPLDVVLEQVLVHRIQFAAAHVVVVVGGRVAEFLPVEAVFRVVRLVALVVVVVA